MACAFLPSKLLLFVLAALLDCARCEVSFPLAVADKAEFQEKFDFGSWASEQSSWIGQQTEELKKKAIKTSTDASAAVTNITGSFADDLESKTKRTAFSSVLVFLGKCPAFYSALPKVPKIMAPKLAEAFQEYEHNPSQDATFCAEAASKAVAKALDENLAPDESSPQEKAVVQFMAEDRAKTVCSESLMTTLKIEEEIRRDHPEPYKEALRNKLLLDVLTGVSLKQELDKLCQGHEYSRLFSKRGDSNDVGMAKRNWPWQRFVVLGAAASITLAILIVNRVSTRRPRSTTHTRILDTTVEEPVVV